MQPESKPKLNIKRVIDLMTKTFIISITLYGVSFYLEEYLSNIQKCHCGGLAVRGLVSFCSCEYTSLIGWLDIIMQVFLPLTIISIGIIALIKIIIPLAKRLKKYLYTNE